MQSLNILITTTAVTAAVSGIVGAVVAALVAAARTNTRKAVDENKAMLAGMRALLWREIKNVHADAMSDGGMTVTDRRHLENVYGAYHAIDGNGTGTRMYEDAMQSPVLDG